MSTRSRFTDVCYDTEMSAFRFWEGGGGGSPGDLKCILVIQFAEDY